MGKASVAALGSIADTLDELAAHAESARGERQQLLEAVENAAVRALGHNFDNLALVGSVTLGIDTPASDLDAAIFTKESVVDIDALTRVKEELDSEWGNFDTEVITRAKVPILAASTPRGLAIDVSMNNHMSVEHVRFFKRFVRQPAGSATAADFHGALLRLLKFWL